MALDDCVSYDGELGGMELSIPAFGSGYSINDILVCGSCATHDMMELSIPIAAQGSPNDILTGEFPHNNSMMLTYGYVWPDEDNVDNGVPYGVTGERTGNLVQPAVNDVKKTVQYGAHGTEFTGTYDPGGAPTPPPNPRPKFGGGLG